MTGDNDIPIGVAKTEGGGTNVQPPNHRSCPACGYQHFGTMVQFRGGWSPRAPTTADCPECGATFELVARHVEDE